MDWVLKQIRLDAADRDSGMEDALPCGVRALLGNEFYVETFRSGIDSDCQSHHKCFLSFTIFYVHLLQFIATLNKKKRKKSLNLTML